MKCEHCGAEIDILAKFCPECGEDIMKGDKIEYQGGKNVKYDIKPEVFSNKPEEDVGLAILAYVPLFIIIPLLKLKDNDEFVRFHANNGIILLVERIIVYFVVFVLLKFGELFGGEAVGGVGTILNFLVIPVVLFLIITYTVPFIGCIKGRKTAIPLFKSIKIFKDW